VVTNAARIAMREWIRSPVECNVISYDSLLEDTPLHSHSRHLIQNCAQNAYSMLFIEDTTTNPSFSNSSLRWTCRHDRVCPVPNQSGDSDMHQAILHQNLLDTIPNPTPVLQQYEQAYEQPSICSFLRSGATITFAPSFDTPTTKRSLGISSLAQAS
jgi:hypothetical protein